MLKNSSGAASLAERMAAYTTGMDVYELDVRTLQDAPPAWNFYRPLPEAKFFELVESIEKNGLISPLIVWDRPEGMTLLSGHNRRRALLQLHAALGANGERFLRAHCVVKRGLDEDEARAILVDSNWVQRELTPSERAKSICFKYAQLGRSARGAGRRYEAIAEHFGLKATQVYQYYRLAGLEPEWLEKLDAGRLSIAAAVRLSRCSPELRARIAVHAPSNRQILRVKPGCSPEALEGLLSASSIRQGICTIEVPETHYEAIQALVEAYLAQHADEPCRLPLDGGLG